MQSWKTRSRRTVLDYGKFLTVENHTVELPDGQVITDWPWLITPDYVDVVAVTAEEEFLCFRQTKYGIEGVSLAVVGGYLERGEDPLAGAQRELLEETGYQATTWTNLGQYRVDANRGAGMAHLFLAQEAVYMREADADDLEEQELVLFRRSEIETALMSGQFKVLAWTTAVALALHRLQP